MVESALSRPEWDVSQPFFIYGVVRQLMITYLISPDHMDHWPLNAHGVFTPDFYRNVARVRILGFLGWVAK